MPCPGDRPRGSPPSRFLCSCPRGQARPEPSPGPWQPSAMDRYAERSGPYAAVLHALQEVDAGLIATFVELRQVLPFHPQLVHISKTPVQKVRTDVDRQ